MLIITAFPLSELECLDSQYGFYRIELHMYLAVCYKSWFDHIVSRGLEWLNLPWLNFERASSFVFICGVGSGGFFALQSAIVSQILGSHRVNAGISWLEVSGSFGYLAGPISAGALLDAFGGADQGAGPYRPAMVSLISSLYRRTAEESFWVQ